MTYNELYHHGILGQKWGVRRYQNEDGSLTATGKKKYADDTAKADRKEALKNRRSLSDTDIKKRIERLKVEKQLKELTEEDISPGKKAVSDILASSGKKAATAVVTGAALYAVKAAVSKEFNVKELASYMTPKPKSK